MISSWWQSQSKGARVFTRVAVVTGLVIVGIHYNQHQERQVCVIGQWLVVVSSRVQTGQAPVGLPTCS